MPDLFYSLTVFGLTLLGLLLLGLAAGFSPTLYIAQISAASRKQTHMPFGTALMAGVLGAVLLLLALFQTIQLDTLLAFLDSTFTAVLVSAVFNIFVGIGLVVGGIWYINHRAEPKPRMEVPKKGRGTLLTAFGFGFIRTFTSISGVTATYLAGNAIATVSAYGIEQLIYTAVFLAATVVPFVVIIVLLTRNAIRLKELVQQMNLTLKRFNYQLTIGASAVILGSSIIILHLMLALFY